MNSTLPNMPHSRSPALAACEQLPPKRVLNSRKYSGRPVTSMLSATSSGTLRMLVSIRAVAAAANSRAGANRLMVTVVM